VFTGIIESVGSVVSVRQGSGSRVILVSVATNELELGESVAVNGVCLTVAALPASGQAEFYVSPETMSRTNLGRLKANSRVNLERALALTDRLSGHFVQGHVDGLGRWVSANTTSDGGSHEVSIEVPAAQARYLIEKGSIALNGVSLTVNSLTRAGDGSVVISIMLIPHTWSHTNFAELKPGDPVNVEVDMLAKYVESLCQSPNRPNQTTTRA
jgi:riboflavin synthase